MLGALAHGIGQILIAVFIVGTSAVFYYLPFILLLSIGTGIFSGVLAKTYLKRSITNKYIQEDNIE